MSGGFKYALQVLDEPHTPYTSVEGSQPLRYLKSCRVFRRRYRQNRHFPKSKKNLIVALALITKFSKI